jgi:hypothetical protein
MTSIADLNALKTVLISSFSDPMKTWASYDGHRLAVYNDKVGIMTDGKTYTRSSDQGCKSYSLGPKFSSTPTELDIINQTNQPVLETARGLYGQNVAGAIEHGWSEDDGEIWLSKNLHRTGKQRFTDSKSSTEVVSRDDCVSEDIFSEDLKSLGQSAKPLSATVFEFLSDSFGFKKIRDFAEGDE